MKKRLSGRDRSKRTHTINEIVRKGGTADGAPTDRYPFAIAKSDIHGVGVFTLARLPKRKKIGELTGRLVPLPDARRKVQHRRRIFLVEIDGRWALDCSTGSCLGHVNHNCKPNCYLRIAGKRVEMYTLREIPANSELTIDYGETPHAGGMHCICGAKNCKGRL